jgi:hypothetical protein
MRKFKHLYPKISFQLFDWFTHGGYFKEGEGGKEEGKGKGEGERREKEGKREN